MNQYVSLSRISKKKQIFLPERGSCKVANPKYKTSHSKTRRRRANIRLVLPALSECPQCHEPKLAHHLCKACGFYKGREVFKLEEIKKS